MPPDRYRDLFSMARVIDAHAHIGEDKDGHKMGGAGIIKLMDQFGIDRSVVFALNTARTPKDFVLENTTVYRAFRRYPDRLIPFFRLNPHLDWRKEFNRCRELGFMGVKLHPRSQNFPLLSGQAKAIYRECESTGMPVLIHAGFGVSNAAKGFYQMKKEFPALKLIVGHACFVDLFEAMRLLRKAPFVVLETSTVRIFDLYDLLRHFPAEKIVFGSDAPYYDHWVSLQMLVDTALVLRKSTREIRGMLGENIWGWFI
ncbi:hypothetical protein COY28_05435 [Candidatus Woesearchaeota archaeon CG_4_10_14_0_2_um_filter_57_5]|nr:MAG: hypothetical protein AUJ68_04100 [Candidatus Woesearchaeota archaeon CG1_02_57_44]PIZ50520.1 MAG: hypothetical protein COY28_05435 [Candidatus Woesearchaeota archaeon CG_4_10_14_0_2_um_filter_57_5]